MGPTTYIKISNTLSHVQPYLARGDATIHTCIEEIMQTDKLESKTSCNLILDTILNYQMSQKLKWLGNGHNNIYQSIQQKHPRAKQYMQQPRHAHKSEQQNHPLSCLSTITYKAQMHIKFKESFSLTKLVCCCCQCLALQLIIPRIITIEFKTSLYLNQDQRHLNERNTSTQPPI